MITKLVGFLIAEDLTLSKYGNNRLILKNIHFFSLSFILLFMLSGCMYFTMHMWSEGAFYSFLTAYSFGLLYLIRSKYYKNIGLFSTIFINMLFMFLGKVMGDESIVQVFLITAIISTYYYTVSKSSSVKLFAFLLVVNAYMCIEFLIAKEELTLFSDIQLKGFIAFLFISFGLLANLFTYNYLNAVNWVTPINEEELFQVISERFEFDKLDEDDSFLPNELLLESHNNDQETLELQEIITCAEIHLTINKVGEESFAYLSDEVAELFEVDLDEALKEPYVIWEKVIDKKKLLKNTFSNMPTKRCITTEFSIKRSNGKIVLLESIGIVHFDDGSNLLHIHEMITEIKDRDKVKVEK